MTNASQTRERTVRTSVRSYGIIERVVFGMAATPLTKAAAALLRKRGYQVGFAGSAELARKAALGRKDTAVVVRVAGEAEGGLLATAKFVTALPAAKVILLAAAENERLAHFAEFIDATYAVETAGAEQLVAAIE